MSEIKVIDYLIKQLESIGITDIFGLPGDFNFNIIEAIERNKNTNWIGCTNELNAGYAADGYARVKGYGALVTTFGVGELSAMNAIAGSYAEYIPVIKIVGIPSTKISLKKPYCIIILQILITTLFQMHILMSWKLLLI